MSSINTNLMCRPPRLNAIGKRDCANSGTRSLSIPNDMGIAPLETYLTELKLLLERKQAPPIALQANHRPAVPLRPVIERGSEGGSLVRNGLPSLPWPYFVPPAVPTTCSGGIPWTRRA